MSFKQFMFLYSNRDSNVIVRAVQLLAAHCKETVDRTARTNTLKMKGWYAYDAKIFEFNPSRMQRKKYA